MRTALPSDRCVARTRGVAPTHVAQSAAGAHAHAAHIRHATHAIRPLRGTPQSHRRTQIHPVTLASRAIPASLVTRASHPTPASRVIRRNYGTRGCCVTPGARDTRATPVIPTTVKTRATLREVLCVRSHPQIRLGRASDLHAHDGRGSARAHVRWRVGHHARRWPLGRHLNRRTRAHRHDPPWGFPRWPLGHRPRHCR